MSAEPSNARLAYRIGLLSAFVLMLREIATVQSGKRARPALTVVPGADDLTAFDASDVLEAHGIELSDAAG